MVPALGLGEISLHSALNQPLEAEIELLQIGDLNADEIKVRLASAEDFSRSGVDRFVFLNDLRFTPVLRGGQSMIRVVSNKPVREPYLNFIVEVVRPGGSLLREYTLLIDPPGSSAYRPVASTLDEPRYAAAPPPARAATPQQAQAQTPMPPATQGQRYRVQPGDSLWSIAGRLREAGSEASRSVLMSDIHRLNPGAFIAGDRDRLRLAADLLLPDSAVPQWIAPSQPQAPVAVDPPVAASLALAPAAEPTPAAESAPIAEAAAELQQIEAAQLQVDGELASQTAENQQLQTAIVDLQAQLAQLQTQMAEKDRQLQTIRAELAQQRQPAPADGPAPVLQSAPAAPTGDLPVAQESSAWPLWLSAGGLCLVLIGGIWLLRRKVESHEPEPYRRPQVQVRPAVKVPTQQVRPAEPVQAKPVAPVRMPSVPADPIEGANIYIAYGHFGEALAVLRRAVEQEPQRIDLRLRLFAVLGELGDANGFFAQEQQLLDMGASHVQVDQIRVRYANLQRPTQADELVAVLPLDEVPEPLPAAQPAADDFQLNLDDLSLDADWDLVSPFKNEAPLRAKAASADALDPSFRSDLRELPEVFEMTVDKDSLSPFGDMPLPESTADEVLHEEFVDAFSREPQGRADKPLESNLEHLAGNREHLAQLNMALAYIEQGNLGAACNILNALIDEGDDQEKARARELLAQIA
ncbi:FimV family protein [Pseudomonas sp. SR9]|uniref:FimV family protein n=2 Tax=Aquipseudomonas guryensis TaxID=2759165 RepID=A0A7W4DEH0_9GAMM|nr:FimV family protein [Pseudomonas guryensis]